MKEAGIIVFWLAAYTSAIYFVISGACIMFRRKDMSKRLVLLAEIFGVVAAILMIINLLGGEWRTPASIIFKITAIFVFGMAVKGVSRLLQGR